MPYDEANDPSYQYDFDAVNRIFSGKLPAAKVTVTPEDPLKRIKESFRKGLERASAGEATRNVRPH